jgi:hypothetical protein
MYQALEIGNSKWNGDLAGARKFDDLVRERLGAFGGGHR